MKDQSKKYRRFSTAFKQEKVDLLDSHKITVKELSKLYQVSETAIYKWKRKYSKIAKTERVVVEKICEEKKNIELLKQIRELEQIIGRKQIEIDYYKSAIAVLSEKEGDDILKKYLPK